MKITLTGATGFLGSALGEALRQEGHELRFLSRSAGGRPGYFAWDPAAEQPPEASLLGADAVIHLAGEPVAQRWSPAVKTAIRRSRVEGTRHLVQAMTTLSPRPQVLVCASATGFYGARGDEVLTEQSKPGTGFLPDVCREWESTADLARALGIRVVKLRTGVALGRGGALQKMLPPFRAGVGGPLAGGRQWMSWIHIQDLVRLIGWAVSNPAVQGAVNGVSPHPIQNKDFTKALAKALHRPAFFPVPQIALQMLYGEMAGILTESQRVLPKAALDLGFQFQRTELGEALSDLV
ncbi:TIGR01777 family oxidoreductase [uncultured Paludibaculum sp.]|uniref:TIGR01777 family oxidoreductase n=1 Tax=uncultured Paludibaculum sp. TaxID=1765020 RepID=UPI002AAC18BE|nr:TIGR01777 family oxidoreductase [uncultured Paludibaculum sp.]